MHLWQKSWKQLFILGLVPLTLLFGTWQSWRWWNWATSAPIQTVNLGATANNSVKWQQIQIPPGTASQQIGRDLEKAGLIRSQLAWDVWARYLEWKNPQGSFQAGTYELSATQPLSAIAQKIWLGVAVQNSYTIPEGWSLRQMAAYFQERKFFLAKDFLAATSQIDRSQFSWLPADLPSLEGFLYPDTYKIARGRISPQDVIKQMLNGFQQVALPLYKKEQKKTPLDLKQWVTLASIVEKEAVVASERPLIAGVFFSRLQKGMRLESDPTVEYALGIRQTADKPLTFAQVKTVSPYNTYLNPGLPPAPIASPGLASLKATLAPEKTDYLFFVARYDGTHVFSRTLQEHQTAVAKIRKERSGL
ncbi:endolytic transglycosylase MltG [Brasilonema sp. CT11]|nr:endolytic transglycosylase MltG [Brasilonema sp. CT11]